MAQSAAILRTGPFVQNSSSTPASATRAWLGPALALSGAFAFSAKSIFAKIAYGASSLDAITLLTFRMIFSIPFFALMLLIARRQGNQTPLTRRDWIALGWLGFIGYYLSSLLDFSWLQYISASLERLILFLNPTIVVALSAIIYKKPVTRRTIAAILLSYAGIVIVFAHDFEVAPEMRALLIGSGLVFASAISYALYLVSNGDLIRRLGATRFTAYGMMISSLFVFTHFFTTRTVSMLDQPSVVYWNMAGMAVFSTVLPIWLSSEAIRLMGSSRVALISTIGPIMTIGLGAIFLHEPVTSVQIIGASLVMAGVALVTLKP